MNSRPSIGKDLFDRIIRQSDPVAFLHAMVNSTPPTVEDEYLDFKGATDPRNGNEIDPKKTWSEALAGFATTGGGVLIWGIDARKDAGGVDHAAALNLVPNPAAWKSRLQELHLQATDPPVSGVQIEACPDQAMGGKGFVVCYVPESDYKPHRAEMANRRWMMRIGSNFVDVPPPVLRSLFFPQRQSYISMHVTSRLEKEGPGLGSRSLRAFLTIAFLNEGPATAVNFVALEKSEPGKVMTKNALWQVHRTRHGNQFVYTQPFHPGILIELWEMWFDIPSSLGARGDEGDMTIEYHICANDQAPQVLRIHYPLLELHDKIKKSATPTPLAIARFQ